MTEPKTTIELPRIDGESPRAYAARVEYVTAGPQRSLDKLAQKYTKNIQLYKKWSSQYGWVESARQYDEQISYLTVQEAADAYRADLADYRKRYSELGRALWKAAANYTTRIIRESADMEIGPGALALAANAAKCAADLEALALRIEDVLRESGGNE